SSPLTFRLLRAHPDNRYRPGSRGRPLRTRPKVRLGGPGAEGGRATNSPSNKEQTPLGDLFRSQPAVSRRLFRCLGAHLLRSPLIVKSSADTLACFLATAGQNPSVENLGSPTPQTVWCLLASSRCRFTQCHSATP